MRKGLKSDKDWTGDGFVNESESMVSNWNVVLQKQHIRPFFLYDQNKWGTFELVNLWGKACSSIFYKKNKKRSGLVVLLFVEAVFIYLINNQNMDGRKNLHLIRLEMIY